MSTFPVRPLFYLLCVLAFNSRPAFAAESLPAIVREGTPGDALSSDPVLPAREGPVEVVGSGSVHSTLQNQLALPVSETGRPGSLAQFRGLGRSPEDVNVYALGIPLNNPQGGGFDFSVFPQFLWSAYRYQPGASLGVFDPRATAGSISLIPLTAERVEAGTKTSGASGFYSGAGVSQLAADAAERFGDARAAVVAGYSRGDIEGPSGSIAAQLGETSDPVWARFQLLATDVDVALPGSATFATPGAHQLTARVIPQFEVDRRFGTGSALLKSSVFYDASYLRYDDPGAGYTTQDHIEQLGIDEAALLESWKVGLSGREVEYRQSDFSPPGEFQGAFQVGRLFEVNDTLLVDPILSVSGVSRFGLLPAGSVGVRHEQGTSSSFVRASLSHRFPSLADRYYAVPGFVGNPDLQPERDWTAVVGTALKGQAFELVLEADFQLREDAQVQSLVAPAALLPTSIKINQGSATIEALNLSGKVAPTPWLVLSDSTTLTDSRVSATGLEFPYMPAVLNALRATWHGSNTDLNLWIRLAGSAQGPAAAERLAGYGLVDIDGHVAFGRHWNAGVRVENLFDRPIEIVKDYPLPGRVASIFASMTL